VLLDEVRLARASSWTFFIKVCGGLQQTGLIIVWHERLPLLAPLIWTHAPSKMVAGFAQAAIAKAGVRKPTMEEIAGGVAKLRIRGYGAPAARLSAPTVSSVPVIFD
jgi:hypothetical protein